MANILFALASLTLGAAAIIGYGAAGDAVLRALLWPHAKITEAFYHISLYYRHGVGYVAAGNGFTIGPACMGIHFIVMLFCLMVCVFIRRFRGFRKLAFFLSSLVGSVVVGVATSCVRIVGSISFLSSGQFTALHAGMGIALYMAALVGIYFLINRATGGFYETHR